MVAVAVAAQAGAISLDDAGVVERAWRRWGLEDCCSLEELALWFAAARVAAHVKEPPPSAKLFCADAAPAWCTAQRRAGRCAETDEQVTQLVLW